MNDEKCDDREACTKCGTSYSRCVSNRYTKNEICCPQCEHPVPTDADAKATTPWGDDSPGDEQFAPFTKDEIVKAVKDGERAFPTYRFDTELCGVVPTQCANCGTGYGECFEVYGRESRTCCQRCDHHPEITLILT